MKNLFKSKLILISLCLTVALYYGGEHLFSKKSIVPSELTSTSMIEDSISPRRSPANTMTNVSASERVNTLPVPEKYKERTIVKSTAFHIIRNDKRVYDEAKMQEISKSANLEEIPYQNSLAD